MPGDFVRRVRFVPEEETPAQDEIAYRVWHSLRLADQTRADLFADYDCQRMFLHAVNKGADAIDGLALALNKNALGIVVAEQPRILAAVESGDVGDVAISLTVDPAQVGNVDKNELQIALKTGRGVIYPIDRIPPPIGTVQAGNIGQEKFREYFQQFTAVTAFVVDDAVIADENQLADARVFVAGKNGNKVYVSFAFVGG